MFEMWKVVRSVSKPYSVGMVPVYPPAASFSSVVVLGRSVGRPKSPACTWA